QAAAVRLIPETAILVHGREAERLPNRTAAGGRVANVADHDAWLAIDVLEECRPNRDVRRTSDDGVVRIDAKRGKERVHGAAHPLVEPHLAREDFTQRTKQQEVDGQI